MSHGRPSLGRTARNGGRRGRATDRGRGGLRTEPDSGRDRRPAHEPLDLETREILTKESAYSLPAHRVVEDLGRVSMERGRPTTTQLDNGPEFRWVANNGREAGMAPRRATAVTGCRRTMQSSIFQKSLRRLAKPPRFTIIGRSGGISQDLRVAYIAEPPRDRLGKLRPAVYAVASEKVSPEEG